MHTLRPATIHGIVQITQYLLLFIIIMIRDIVSLESSQRHGYAPADIPMEILTNFLPKEFNIVLSGNNKQQEFVDEDSKIYLQ